MLFNSIYYIFLFLPLVFALYFTLTSYSHKMGKVFLVLASLFFYGWWHISYLKLLLGSILANYFIASLIQRQNHEKKRLWLLIAGIVFNIALLGYFKYANFFIDNANALLDAHYKLKHIILPLGISFFTFTQTAFLVDTYRRQTQQYGLINYTLFVSYFPHLLAGPIIHHAQVMPQFDEEKNARINYKNIYFGLMLFVIGLAKKVLIADTFAIFANQGYDNIGQLQFASAWVTSLAYTFQLYFDFSGYTDMAIGVSKMFNIELPINFNSPYKAKNIQDFWRRWHITLSNFLRDYIYIPLGGNRVKEAKIHTNLLITFLIGGFWHGAGWTFVFWGFLHGAALCVHKLFGKLNITLPSLLSWFITFMFVNIAWVFFRANNLQDAFQVVSCMFDISGLAAVNPLQLILLALALLLATLTPNSQIISESRLANKLAFTPLLSLIFLASIISIEISNSHAFIYFQF